MKRASAPDSINIFIIFLLKCSDILLVFKQISLYFQWKNRNFNILYGCSWYTFTNRKILQQANFIRHASCVLDYLDIFILTSVLCQTRHSHTNAPIYSPHYLYCLLDFLTFNSLLLVLSSFPFSASQFLSLFNHMSVQSHSSRPPSPSFPQ